MLFAIILLALILVAILFLPAIRQSKVSASEQSQTQKAENLRLYEERVNDLSEMDLSDSEKAQMQLELDRELLAAVDSAGDTYSVGPERLLKSGFSAGLLLLATVAGVGLYQLWGAGNEVRATQLLEYSVETELTPDEYTELEQRLSSAASRQPENMEWAFLQGRLYEAEGRYADAADAYDALLLRLPEEQMRDRAAILTQSVQARFFANNQQPDDALYERLLEALSLTADDRKALGLAGILAYELGRYEDAISHWRGLWVQLPPGVEAMTLENGIRRAAEVIEQSGGTTDLSWLVPAAIRVTVDISDQARAAVSANATVFVLARALDGPPMPLAVQRLVVSQLPTTVVLDNTTAMAAGANLGAVEEVTVTARVSLSGQPLAQPGDWQVQKHNVPTRGAAMQSLVISHIVE